MKIDRNLNLVLTVDQVEGPPAYVHARAISQVVYDTYWRPLSLTHAEMSKFGWAWVATQGPRNAARVLKDVAIELGVWEGPGGVETGLLPEMVRLATVLMPAKEGWEQIPLQEALDRKRLDATDSSEVVNALTFFIVCSSSMKAERAAASLRLVFGMSDEQLTFSSATDFLSSLKTLTPEELTGARATP